MNAINGHENLSELLAELLNPNPIITWILPSSALVNLLQRYLADEIAAKDIETLADALEMNEIVVYEQTHEEIIAETLFILSTPEINGRLTHSIAKTLIQRLK
jgi:hypothetical protein